MWYDGGSHLLARKWWLPPRGPRPALRFARPPRNGGGGLLVPWARPPPPLVRFAPSLLGPALFLFGGVVAPGLGVFRPCGGGWGARPPGPREGTSPGPAA